MLRVSQEEVVRLDGEDVGEVVAHLERDLELDAPPRVVFDDDVVLHPLSADEALARDRELVLLQVAGKRVPQEEGGREVLDLARREQERAGAVDREDAAGEEASVVGEEAHGRPVEVAALVANAERRAFQDRQGHGTLL